MEDLQPHHGHSAPDGSHLSWRTGGPGCRNRNRVGPSMCWDESWEDQWFLSWTPGVEPYSRPKSVGGASPPIAGLLQSQENHEAEAAVREVTRLVTSRRSQATPRFVPALTAWLRRRPGKPTQPGVPQERIPTGRR